MREKSPYSRIEYSPVVVELHEVDPLAGSEAIKLHH
jgi:hypothetical protein